MKSNRLLALMLVISVVTVPFNLLAQQVSVKGRITDAKTNAPLQGASVKIKNDKAFATTNADGRFTIVAPSSESVISVTYVGYQVYETRAGDGNLAIALTNLGLDLDDVVVVGYGSQKRGNLTGSVATADMAKIEELPVPTILEALKGQLPGVNVSGGSQRPGDNPSLSIRQNFGFSKDGFTPLPLIIIDDIIQVDPNTGNPSLDVLNTLNPNEVESITFIKDGTAAIYGARAAQGAVIVKTKRGKAGPPKISYAGKFQFNDAVSFGKTMSAYEHGIFTNRYGRAAGWSAGYLRSDAELESAKSLNYDWLDAAWKAAGSMQHSVTVSGGSDRATYFAGGSYYTQSANLGNQDYNKYTFRTGTDIKVTNGLKLSASISAFNSKVEKSFTKISINDGAYASGSEQTDYAVLAHMPKYIPWEYTVNGVTEYISPALGSNRNPPSQAAGQNNISGWNYFALLNNGSFTKDDNQGYNATFSLQYDVPYVKGLALKATYGINYSTYNNDQAMLGMKLALAINSGAAGHHLYTDSSTFNVSINNNRSTVRFNDVINKAQQGNFFITYDNRFRKHNFSGLVSVEKAVQNYQKKFLIYDVPIYGAFNGSSPSAGTLNTSNSYVYRTDAGSLGYLGRLSYDYDGKYLLQFVFRTDASTKFAPDKYWGFFPGLSAGWVVTREDWFRNKVKFIDYLKVRGSIGKTGKDNLRAFRWTQTYAYAADKAVGFGNSGGLLVAGLTPDASPNPLLTWDENLRKNIGFDVTFLRNRLSLTFDRYWDHQSRLFTQLANQVGIPISVGGGFAEQNFAEVKSHGYEISANWKDQKKNFSYSIGINFGSGNNEVVKWYDVPFDYPSKIGTKQGYSLIRPSYGFRTWNGTSGGDGLLRTDADIDAYWQYLTDLATAAGTTPKYLSVTQRSAMKKGMLAYQDLAGDLDANNQTIAGPDGQVATDEDYTELASNKGLQGFVTSLGFSWKGISLNTQISTSWGGYNRIDYVKQGTSSGQMFWAHESYMNDMFDETDNPTGKYPNIFYSDSYINSDFWQISSFRCFVRSLAVGYTIPKNISSKIRMESLKVSLAGFNLWDFYNPYPDKYRNMYDDPKTPYPTLRTWSIGINANF